MVAVEHEVRVEAYRGPLDLLLFLIRDEEVDIYDIPIARILERYLEEMARMPVVDINAAADFLLMAATLMEIKSRQMLPPEERQEMEIEGEDPRSDLIRQLLEYRRFRQAADELGVMAGRRALLFGRAAFGQGLPPETDAKTEPGEDLRDVGIYDLLAAFERLMKATLADAPRTIVYDDISVEERIEELLLAMRDVAGNLRFSEFYRRAADRADAAGIFTAILEATRRKLVTVAQPEPFGELYVAMRGERPDTDFAPAPGEQPPELSAKEMTVRRGIFDGFMSMPGEEAEEELDFALDTEGRRAVERLDEAVRRADEAIRRLSRPRTPEPDTGAQQAAGVPGAQPPAPQAVLVRQWTDPDRQGSLVFIGPGLPVTDDRPPVARRFGRRLQPRRLRRAGPAPAAVAAGRLPGRTAPGRGG